MITTNFSRWLSPYKADGGLKPPSAQTVRELRSLTGFTLIECVISLLLLAVVLVGGMAFYFYSDKSLTIATHRRMATELANARLEELKSGGLAGLPNPVPPPANIDIGSLVGQQAVSISDVDDPLTPGTNDYKQVQVKIDWSEPEQTSNQEVVLDTFIAR